MRIPDTAVWTVYLLIDPRDGEIRYVGCSMRLRERYWGHISDGRFAIRNPDWRGGSTPKAQWIKELLQLGLMPIMEPLVKTRSWDYRFLEEGWIRRIGLAGCKLLITGGREKMLADGKIKPTEAYMAGEVVNWYRCGRMYKSIGLVKIKQEPAPAPAPR